jgi:protein-S-isoprenylcysteine O-methyltransferase Ste14
MIATVLLRLLGYVWAVFGVYWIGAGLRGKAAQTREHSLYRFVRLGILAITFALLFWRRASTGMLGWRFIPDSLRIACAGLCAALCGLAIAVWARIHLGQYWSDKVVLKVDHDLIRRGPYARMRHPIYSGVLLAVAGTALVLGELRGVLAFTLLLTNYTIKARREERILADCFGEQFREYLAQAGFLLPRFTRRAESGPSSSS